MSSMTNPNPPSTELKSQAPSSEPKPNPNPAPAPKLQSTDLNFYYGSFHALHGISLPIYDHCITSFIGPSGCGKSTFLRTLNRMYETVRNARAEGNVTLDGQSILNMEVSVLRRRVGMVFQRPNPFPKSIFENVAYGLRVNGESRKAVIQEAVERSLRHAALWEEVKNKLHNSAFDLSGGQQQRLCIARALAVNPEVLLMDEPCSALDPIATGKIEEMIFELKKITTIAIVTHNMQQAARVADYTGFFMLGKLVEFSETSTIFQRPAKKETEDYVTGRFG